MHQKIADIYASLLGGVYIVIGLAWVLMMAVALVGGGAMGGASALLIGVASLALAVLFVGLLSVFVAMREDLRAIRLRLESQPRA